MNRPGHLGGLGSSEALAGRLALANEGYRGGLASGFTPRRCGGIQGRSEAPDVIGLIVDRVLRRTRGFHIRVCSAWILLNPLFKLREITHLFSTIGLKPNCLRRKLTSSLFATKHTSKVHDVLDCNPYCTREGF